jgi:hypothetical protein
MEVKELIQHAQARTQENECEKFFGQYQPNVEYTILLEHHIWLRPSSWG